MSAAIRDFARQGIALASGPIARGSITSVIIKVTGLVLSFAQAVLVARLLGTEGYGLVAVALSIAQICAMVAVFGYGTLSTREVAGWLSSGKQHLLLPFTRHALTTIIALSVASGAVIGSTSGFMGEYSSAIMISALIIPAMALLKLFRGVTQGFGDVAGAQWPGEILRPALTISMVGIAILAAHTLTAQLFLLIFALAAFGGVLAAGIVMQRHLGVHRVDAADGNAHPKWFAEATPFFGLSILAVLQAEFATLMLAMFATPEQAGLYQPIARLTPIIALPATAAAMRYAPRVSEFWKSDQLPRLISVTRTYTLATSALTAAATLVLAGLGPRILMVFGAEFVAVAPLLWIVGAAQIFNTACGPVGYLLTMTGHTRTATIAKVAGLVVALGCAVALIPDQGSKGAAIAVAAGLIVWNVISLIAVKRKLGFDPSLLQLFTPSNPLGSRNA